MRGPAPTSGPKGIIVGRAASPHRSSRAPASPRAATTRASGITSIHERLTKRRARVELGEHDARLRFVVADDGRGFDVHGARSGTGVQGMTDRLDAIGGTLAITSEPGRGTTVVGTVPVAEP